MKCRFLPDDILPARSAAVKALVIALFSFTASTNADLIANFETDKGTIEVVLQYQSSPQAVANLITMAKGTRARIDYNTGAVTTKPLYIGETFFRTSNNSFSKFAQTGSGTGSNAGSTGFTFKDEFDPTIRHTGYTLSMANSGPNTNGGQIFFTGNIAIPSYDGRHAIVGFVTNPASRIVVDSIIAAGNDGSRIINVTFDRTDAVALAFDEHAQGLPTVTKPTGKLVVKLNQFSRFDLVPAATTGDIVGAYRSPDLVNWSVAASEHVGISAGALLTPVLLDLEIDNAATPSAFYNISIARHPGSVAPSHFRSRTLTLPAGGGSYSFVFDNSGLAGNVTYTPSTGAAFGGPFTILSQFTNTGAHHFQIVTDSPSINPRNLKIQMGADTATNSLVTGHQITSYWNGVQWSEYPTGSCTITR